MRQIVRLRVRLRRVHKAENLGIYDPPGGKGVYSFFRNINMANKGSILQFFHQHIIQSFHVMNIKLTVLSVVVTTGSIKAW